jgi:hypothetical protein
MLPVVALVTTGSFIYDNISHGLPGKMVDNNDLIKVINPNCT